MGLSLSVPFILIAFNLDKAAAVLKYVRPAAGTPKPHIGSKSKEEPLKRWKYIPFYSHYVRSFMMVLLLAVGAVVILAPIWTSHLAFRVKLAVTITIAVLPVLGALGMVFLHYRQKGSGTSSDTFSSTGDTTLD